MKSGAMWLCRAICPAHKMRTVVKACTTVPKLTCDEQYGYLRCCGISPVSRPYAGQEGAGSYFI